MTDIKKHILVKKSDSLISKAVLETLADKKEKLRQLNALWQPHDRQREVLLWIFKQEGKASFIRAGRRSGKTDPAIYCAVRKAISLPNQKILVVTPTLKQAKKIYWKSKKIHKFIPPEWGCRFNNDELTVYFPNGSFIEIDGSDNTEAQRGAEYDLVILDEYKDINPILYSEVIEPTMATTDGTVIIIGTPPKTKNHHYVELEQIARTDDSWRFFHYTTHDNPYAKKDWLIKKERQLKERGELDVWKREYLAEYCFGGKDQVFPMFSKRKHTKPLDTILAIMKRDWSRFQWIVSADPATSSTFAVLFVAHDPYSNRTFVLDEIYAKDKSQMSSRAIWEQIKQKTNKLNPNADWEYIYDEAAAWFSNEIEASFGIGLIPSQKSANQKEDGISLWKDLMLIDNAFTVASECTSFIFEIESYIMENDKYPKILDHCLDAFRYVLGYLSIDFSLQPVYDNDKYIEDDIDFVSPEQNLLDLKEWIH